MRKKIQHKLPKPGTAFERKWRDKSYRLQVVEKNGTLAYEVGGRIFSTPSAAAKSITKQEVNGWRFWHMD
jgi:hypothetical protein